MQKAADAADISVLFFSAGANFWAIFGPFRQFWVIFGLIWAILGHFWAILGNFRSFLGHLLVLFFVAKYASVLFKSLFATLLLIWNKMSKNIRNAQISIIPPDTEQKKQKYPNTSETPNAQDTPNTCWYGAKYPSPKSSTSSSSSVMFSLATAV